MTKSDCSAAVVFGRIQNMPGLAHHRKVPANNGEWLRRSGVHSPDQPNNQWYRPTRRPDRSGPARPDREACLKFGGLASASLKLNGVAGNDGLKHRSVQNDSVRSKSAGLRHRVQVMEGHPGAGKTSSSPWREISAESSHQQDRRHAQLSTIPELGKSSAAVPCICGSTLLRRPALISLMSSTPFPAAHCDLRYASSPESVATTSLPH